MEERQQKSIEDALESPRKLLHSELFLGVYKERRYIEKLRDYRDVVEVAPSETAFLKHLQRTRTKLLKSLGPEVVLGISSPPNLTLFVSLKHSVPLGKHWFKVQDLVLSKNTKEVMLKIKHVREVTPALEPISNISSTNLSDETQDSQLEVSNWGPILSEGFRKATSPEGVVCGLRMFLLVLVATATGLLTAAQKLLALAHAILQESSKIIRASTPLLLGIANILARLLAGLMVFLGMIWKDLFYLLRRKVDPEGTPPTHPTLAPRSWPALPPPPMLQMNRGPQQSYFPGVWRPPSGPRSRRGVRISEIN